MKYKVSDLSKNPPQSKSNYVSHGGLLRNLVAVNEPGLQIQCDSCMCDLTHSIRIKCADPICEPGDGVDICPGCFCVGKEFAKHKRGHAYRVIVSQCVGALAPLRLTMSFLSLRNYIHILSFQMIGVLMSMSVFSLYHLKFTPASCYARELLLIEGISKAGFGNWQMIAEHVGTRTKEEVEEHYNAIYVDSPNWPLPVSRRLQTRAMCSKLS